MVFVLNEKAGEKDKHKDKDKTDINKVKKDNFNDKKAKMSEKDKIKVKADWFGAALDAHSVRSSRNLRVVFHVRPVISWLCCCHVTLNILLWQPLFAVQSYYYDSGPLQIFPLIAAARCKYYRCRCPGGFPRTAPASGPLRWQWHASQRH